MITMIRPWTLAILLSTVLGAPLAVSAAPTSAPVGLTNPEITGKESPTQPALPATVQDGFTIAAGGDLLGFWRPRTPLADPELAKVFKLFQNADAGFANREANVFDLRAFKGAPAAENGGFDQMNIGGGPLASASTAADMKAAGITMLSLANNHSADWGLDGLAETEASLDRAGVVHAGTGRSRAAARAAAFLETPRGRVALIATASTFMPMAVAGPGEGEKGARPGISALRTKPVTLVTQSEFAALNAIATRQGMGAAPDATEVVLNPNEQTLNDLTFRLADQPGLTYQVNQDDVRELMDAVRKGKRASDLAVFSIHAHETASGAQEDKTPADQIRSADFLPTLFHAAVDAGADVVITHGPHVLHGIEIYKGKPIFYGLGSLFFELGSDWPQEWFDSVVAVSEFRGGKVAEVRLYPITLRPTNATPRRSERGVPHLAGPADAKRILETLQRASSQYGTQIVIKNNVGVIRVTPEA